MASVAFGYFPTRQVLAVEERDKALGRRVIGSTDRWGEDKLTTETMVSRILCIGVQSCYHPGGGGRSSAGLALKNPSGRRRKPTELTGITGQSSTRGMCV